VSDLVERLAARYEPVARGTRRKRNEAVARWWLNAIADELDRTEDTDHWNAARWLRGAAQHDTLAGAQHDTRGDET